MALFIQHNFSYRRLIYRWHLQDQITQQWQLQLASCPALPQALPLLRLLVRRKLAAPRRTRPAVAGWYAYAIAELLGRACDARIMGAAELPGALAHPTTNVMPPAAAKAACGEHVVVGHAAACA